MITIMSCALFFSYDGCRKGEMRVRVLEELLRFIRHARMMIECYLTPISEISRSFSSDALSQLGFLSDIEQIGVSEAYIALRKKVGLSGDGARILETFFLGVGRGYAESELQLIDSALSELSGVLITEREALSKGKKLSLTLYSAGALALIILLI